MRFIATLDWSHKLTCEIPRIKMAKGLEEARMKPTLKKPSGKRTGQNVPASSQSIQTFKHNTDVTEDDEYETDTGGKDESEDLKPAGGLTRSSSVG